MKERTDNREGAREVLLILLSVHCLSGWLPAHEVADSLSLYCLSG
jgi:hypothetical protein